jgi:branched-chain amino acid transport system ATP-binding protein
LEKREERPLLEVEKITKSFGGLTALLNIDLLVNKNEILGLIGPNGSGKTTLFNIIAGNLRQDGGGVYFEGQDCSQMKPFERCRLGIARTYQAPRPFLDFSVEQNVMVGLRYGQNKDTRSFVDIQKRGEEILKMLGLEERRGVLVKNLTLVDRKFVEVARALATNPKLLLLDEVLSGLNPAELEEAVKLIKSLSASFGITIIWIEHIMQSLLAICDRFVVLLQGTKLMEGGPEQVVSDERVIEAYLGRGGKRLTEKACQPHATVSRED